MDSIAVYRSLNGVETQVCLLPANNASRVDEIMSRQEVTAAVSSDTVSLLEVGDYIRIDGLTYTLNRTPSLDEQLEVLNAYDYMFEGPGYNLLDKVLVNPITNQSKFYLTNDLRGFVGLIVTNVNRTAQNPEGTDTGWSVGSVSDTVRKNLLFESITCYDTLAKLCNEFAVEYYLVGKQINFVERIETRTDLIFEQGRGKGLYKLRCENVDSDNTITRARIYGGSQNLPDEYKEEGRLRLPEKYLEDFSEYKKVVERDVFFDDVHPTFTGTIDRVGGENYTQVVSNSIDFDVEAQKVGVLARINILTGDLMGIDFEFNYDHPTHTVTLIRKEHESRGTLPNDNWKPAPGDTFNFTGTKPTQQYTDRAIALLREKGRDWLNYYKQLRVKFTLEVDHRYLRQKNISLRVGDVVRIRSSRHKIDKQIRINSITTNLYTGAISCVVSNYIVQRWEKQMEGKIQYNAESAKMLAEAASNNILAATKDWSLRNLARLVGGNIFTGLQKFLNDIRVGGNSSFDGRVGSPEFSGGLLGSGWNINPDAGAEFNSLILRMFLQTPEWVKNKIRIIGSEGWFTESGVVESIRLNPFVHIGLKSETGALLGTRYDGKYLIKFGNQDPYFKYDDILRGVYDHDNGFATVFLRVEQVIGERYIVSSINGSAPAKNMVLARQGNFTNKDRQGAIYFNSAEAYIRVLGGMDSMQIKAENLMAQLGSLSSLYSFGISNMPPVGLYTRSGVFKGVSASDIGADPEGMAAELVAAFGSTIIEGGYLKNVLINTDTLIAKNIKTDNVKILDDGTVDINATKEIPTYNPDGSTTYTSQTIKISNSLNEISCKTEGGTSSMSSQGIYANKAGVQTASASSGLGSLSSVVALGRGDLSKENMHDKKAIIGVYGEAYNSAINPRDTFGGFFNKLAVRGMNLQTETVGSVCFISQGNSHINAQLGALLYMPSNRVIGDTYLITTLGNGIPLYENGAPIFINGVRHTNGLNIALYSMYWIFWDGERWSGFKIGGQ